MCGRYLIEDETYSDILELINIPDANLQIAVGEIFPTNIAPVITQDGAAAVKWGFPHWKGAGVIINARAETAMEKNMFKKPLLEQRCVVPSSGFYEWDHTGGRKEKDKYLLRAPGEKRLYMAGIFSEFRDSSGHEYNAFVILTTAASGTVAQIHDRMPLIIAPDEQDMWIREAGFMEHALRRPGPDLVCALVPR